MSFLLWQRDRDVAIASRRRVLTAAEVGPLLDAQALCQCVADLAASRAAKIDEAADAARTAARIEGLELGRREAREEISTTLSSLAATAAAERDRLRGEVGSLALEVVRKILGQFAPEVVLVALARSALDEMLPAPAVTLVIHPDRVDAVRESLADERVGDCANGACIEVRADPGCAPDDCRIETALGVVDAALAVRLARIAQAWETA
ncbi:MAG TPA: FliH/SctL family protein [Solirubrobacteraceae bacterium]|nr:FliH/SctL family protein [Solirubrobacteraceae bacterium]